MSDSLNDMRISEMSKMAKKNHGLIKAINLWFANISDKTIRSYYNTYGETMFEQLQTDLKYFKDNIPDNLKRIRELKEKDGLTSDQIKQLDESEKLAEDSLELLDNTENNIKNIMKRKRLNNARIGTLAELARETVFENNILPENDMQLAVLYEDYPSLPNEPSGGFRNRKNKTNNKKYAKKRTYKRPKKRVSKKNKTRKMKKNYL
jgi:hypothetical protein